MHDLKNDCVNYNSIILTPGNTWCISFLCTQFSLNPRLNKWVNIMFKAIVTKESEMYILFFLLLILLETYQERINIEGVHIPLST